MGGHVTEAAPDAGIVRPSGRPLRMSADPICHIASAPAGERGVELTITGEIDLSVADEVHAAITRLAREGIARVVVDLRGLTFLDSSGLRALSQASQDAEALGARVCLDVREGPVARLLDMTGTRALFRFRGT
jgi:anti-sigma B factor antagonist